MFTPQLYQVIVTFEIHSIERYGRVYEHPAKINLAKLDGLQKITYEHILSLKELDEIMDTIQHGSKTSQRKEDFNINQKVKIT